MTRIRRRSVGAVVVTLGLLLAACGGGGGGKSTAKGSSATTAGGGSSTTAKSSGGSSSATTAKVQDVLPDPSVQLAPDVVIVRSDGGKAVKGFASDGRHLTIAANAEGADQLAAGKILLLTGVTVARVKSLQRSGDNLVIEGGPVAVSDVIVNGQVAWNDVVMDLHGARAFVTGKAASSGSSSSSSPGGGGGNGGLTDEQLNQLWQGSNDSMSGSLGPIGAAQPVALRTQSDEGDTDDSGGGGGEPNLGAELNVDKAGVITFKGDLGDPDDPITYTVTVNPDTNNPSFHAELGMGDDLAGSIALDIELKQISHSGNLGVKDKEVQQFGAQIKQFTGTATVTAQVQGLENVSKAVTGKLLDFPFKVEVPLPIAGIPFTFSVEGTVQVTISIAMANNSLSGQAKVQFAGPAGFQFENQGLTVNGQRVENSDDLLKTVKGTVSGPVGMVVTTELPKLTYGLGWGWIGKGDVFFSNGLVASFHILPMPAACTATNVAHVMAAGAEASFLGGFWKADYRQPISDKRWNYQVPNDGRCNAE